MSIQIGWDETHAGVLRCDFVGVKQPAEYEFALEKIKVLVSPDPTQTLKFMIIIESASSEDLPQVSVLRFMRSLLDLYSERTECMVIVTPDLLLDALLQLIQPFYRHFGIRLSNSSDVQQAFAYLDKNSHS